MTDRRQLAVVGVGASAGGLDACKRLLEAVPPRCGLTFILVQHLDPTHASMMVELLAGHEAVKVVQAGENMPLKPEHLYVIPPNTYLSVGDGVLHLSPPQAPHGARLPFDFLLQSLAEFYGTRAACVILSGTGADGSTGLLAIKKQGGLVVAQTPQEAGYDGMPRNALQTGKVDLVLPIADIPAALVAHFANPAVARKGETQESGKQKVAGNGHDVAQQWLPRIIDLLRTETVHDFTLYKPGTLERRVARRMTMAHMKPEETDRYLNLLRSDRHELDLLAQDLLIHVTGFFRDRRVFDRLAETIIPKLVDNHPVDSPLRIWVAGCSTGEETYSLAMLFLERFAVTGRPIKLQVFASDVDPQAITTARDGVYPESIESCVNPQRLARFFSRQDEGGWRVVPELRAAIVFTVQDVLADPPFSRIDLVSCRNLLIYLRPDAQEKVISLFHFALREDGILVLGSAETAGAAEGQFEIVSKVDRIYRRLARGRVARRPAETGSVRPGSAVRLSPGPPRLASRPAALAELGRRLVIATYAPAAILINAANEVLFTLGPTDRYLRLPPGHATHDLLAMARPGLRAKLAAAIQTARETKVRVVVGCRLTRDGQSPAFNLEVRPVVDAGEEMLLVCFVETASSALTPDRPGPGRPAPRLAELERDLDASRAELQAVVRDLELSTAEQKAINEEALSVNEEYQSTNEELLASKEELQSLNEELTALNSQLQETLERQRTTADDLQNILYSTNVATLFLDSELRIRFFTPATKSLFAIIASDIGRPLSDLAAMAPDGGLEIDARRVLETLEPVEREIEANGGGWFRRRILPYRTHGDRVEGVVITFTDITAARNAVGALEAAKRQADIANAAKSRFLAAASHDLRQPLQTLTLLHALLARTVESERARSLVARLDDTVGAMAAMLNVLLDINEIEAGVVHAEVVSFSVDNLLERMRTEFTDLAQAKGLVLRVVPCRLQVLSDPRLLEQMVRNLLSNALKYTPKGKILLGCRRHGEKLSVEVWDSGIGIPEAQFDAIFEEYFQVGNAARERSLGLGLGLSIVKRLARLLDHRVRVRSHHGAGSCFTIEIPLSAVETDFVPVVHKVSNGAVAVLSDLRGTILVVEDDPDLRELLGLLLEGEGFRVTTAPDGPAALASLAGVAPDLLLADYNLPNGFSGLDLAARVREMVRRDFPVIILTGDISTRTLRDVARQGFTQLNKPVKRVELLEVIDRLLTVSPPAPAAELSVATGQSSVFVVDDDDDIRGAMTAILEDVGLTVASYRSGEAFLEAYRPGGDACLLIDAYLPGMDGIQLLEHLRKAGHQLPAIMITGHSDVPMAVHAMKAGAVDFIEKPVGRADLLASIGRALDRARGSSRASAGREEAATHLAGLTSRQRQIMTLVLAGHPSKNIALDLGISQRTVENHRAAVMRKTGSASLPALARLAVAAVPDSEP